MQVNHKVSDILELFSRVDAGLDFEVAGVFDFEIVPRDYSVVDLEGFVAEIGHFVGVPGGTDDDVGDLLQVGEDVHAWKGL
jgi:hypothetical protein